MDIFIILAFLLSITIFVLYVISCKKTSNENKKRSKKKIISNTLKNKLIEVGTNYGEPDLLMQNYIMFQERYPIFDDDNTTIVDDHLVISAKNVYEYKEPIPTGNIAYDFTKTMDSRKRVNAKIIIHNKPIGEIYKDDKFTEMDYSGFHKSFRNENLDFYVNSTSKVPLFFVIGNCLFIQKGMNNIIKNFSIFYDDGLRIFEDIKFVNFEIAYL